MSETLPLFPLNAVLFPGGEMELKISEDKYQEMLSDCLKNKSDIGVIYCEDDIQEKASMSEVGCTAKIIDYSINRDGSSLIRIRGKNRFKLGDIDNRKAYLSTNAKPIEDIKDLPSNDPLLKMTEDLAYIYTDLLAEIDPVTPASGFVSPIRMEDSFLLIEQMILPEEYREEALKVTSVKQRFELALSYLRVEIERLRFLLSEPEEGEVVIH